jgi:hypothetical protein
VATIPLIGFGCPGVNEELAVTSPKTERPESATMHVPPNALKAQCVRSDHDRRIGSGD